MREINVGVFMGCEKCKEKDEEIRLLQELTQKLDKTISVLLDV